MVGVDDAGPSDDTTVDQAADTRDLGLPPWGVREQDGTAVNADTVGERTGWLSR